jgi:hypothetical protein
MLEWSETSHLVTFNLDFRHDIVEGHRQLANECERVIK